MSFATSYQTAEGGASVGVLNYFTDANLIVPANVTTVIWDVGQNANRTIDYSLIPVGQEVTLVIIDTGGFNVSAIGAEFVLNSSSGTRSVNVRSLGGGSIALSDGTAAQYDIGTSGSTVPLLNGDNTWSGYERFTGTLKPGVGITATYLGDPEQGGMAWIRSSSPVDWRIFDVIINTGNGNLEFRLVNDAYSLAMNWASIARSGITVVSSTITQLKGLGAFMLSTNTVAGNQTLTAFSAHDQYYTGTGGNTWTLPSPAGNNGLRFIVINDGTGAFDLSGTIRDGGATVATVSVPQDISLLITCNGSRWRTNWFA